MAAKKTDSTAAPKKAAKKANKVAEVAAAEVAPAEVAPAAAVEARPEVVLPADAAPRAHHASHDDVARRAYEIWLARGGSAFENWVEAERQLNRQ